MGWDTLGSGLRWLFWTLAYLGTAAVGILAAAAVPVTRPIRWVIIAALIAGIAADVRQKTAHSTPKR